MLVTALLAVARCQRQCLPQLLANWRLESGP